MILAGFEAATRGRLTLDGRDMTQTPAEARAFGMVFLRAMPRFPT